MEKNFNDNEIKKIIKDEIEQQLNENKKDFYAYIDNKIQEHIHLVLSGYQAQNDSHFTIINNTLNNVNKSLQENTEYIKLHQKEINKLKTSYKLYNQKKGIEKEHRKVTCPQEKRIRIIEDKTMTSGAVRKWIAKTVGVTAGTLTIIYIALKLIGLA